MFTKICESTKNLHIQWKIAFSKYSYIIRLKKTHLISSFNNEVKKKLEKKVAPEYMPMFTEIDYFLKNWWHTECLQTSRTEKWTEHFHTFIANKALHSHLIKTLFFSWHRISIYTCYLNAIYMLIHVSDLISMKKILPLPLIDIIDNLFRIST